MDYSIGIDVGGTKIAAALVSEDGQIVRELRVPTSDAGRDDILASIVDLSSRLHQSAIHELGGQVCGVGIGTAGQVDFSRGVVVSGTSLIRNWFDVPVRDTVAHELGLPVYVDNDVNVMTLTETFFGVAKGHRNVVCLAFGTGVGGGVMADGNILRGSWGAAGELGHVSVHMGGPICNCGQRGCLEAYASGTGLVERMQEAWHRANAAPETEAYRAYLADERVLTSRAVFGWMRDGDVHATAVVDQMLDAIATALIGFIHTFNPSIVVLGGGVMENGAWIREAILRRMDARGMRSLVDRTEIALASFGVQTSVIGAAYQCWLYGAKQDVSA